MNTLSFRFIAISIIATILAMSTAQAQRFQARQKIEAYKVAYLTEKLTLTTDEAQKFWPLYNEYHKKEDSLRKAEHKLMCGYAPDLTKMTDKEVEVFIDQRIMHMQQMTDLRKYYHIKFKEVLPIKKVAELYIAEREFKKYLLEKLKDKPGMPHHGGGPPPHLDEF